MTVFSQHGQIDRPAPRVVELLPSHFADDWSKKPRESMRVGLRLVSEGDIERARAAAVEKAMQMVPEGGADRVDQFNDCVMRGIVARATCMPENAAEPFFEMPEDDVPEALTPEGVAKLFHEFDVLKVESCTYMPEATDDQLVELAVLLGDEQAWQALSVSDSKRLRRMALHLLEELDPELRE